MNDMDMLKWKEEHDLDGVQHVLMYDTKRLACVHRKVYTKDFFVEVPPMHIDKEFSDLGEAKRFAEDCARQCRSEWAPN